MLLCELVVVAGRMREQTGSVSTRYFGLILRQYQILEIIVPPAKQAYSQVVKISALRRELATMSINWIYVD